MEGEDLQSREYCWKSQQYLLQLVIINTNQQKHKLTEFAKTSVYPISGSSFCVDVQLSLVIQSKLSMYDWVTLCLIIQRKEWRNRLLLLSGIRPVCLTSCHSFRACRRSTFSRESQVVFKPYKSYVKLYKVIQKRYTPPHWISSPNIKLLINDGKLEDTSAAPCHHTTMQL